MIIVLKPKKHPNKLGCFFKNKTIDNQWIISSKRATFF